MYKVRIYVEWYFMEVNRYWRLSEETYTLRIGQMPAGLVYQAAVLLKNLQSCTRPNNIAQYFAVQPSSMVEYVGEHEAETNQSEHSENSWREKDPFFLVV